MSQLLSLVGTFDAGVRRPVATVSLRWSEQLVVTPRCRTFFGDGTVHCTSGKCWALSGQAERRLSIEGEIIGLWPRQEPYAELLSSAERDKARETASPLCGASTVILTPE